jgi:phage I-like protein
MTAWATNLGQSNPQALKDYLDTAPKIPALNGKQTETIAANSQQNRTNIQPKI